MSSFPREILKASKALGHEIRLEILEELSLTEELTFSQLKNKLGIDKALLNFHLKKLTASGIVEHYYLHKIGDEEYSFYNITSFGRRLLNAILESMVPSPPILFVEGLATSENYGIEIDQTGRTTKELPLVTSAVLAPSYQTRAKGSNEIYSEIFVEG